MIIHVGGLSMHKITQNSQLNMFTGQQYKLIVLPGFGIRQSEKVMSVSAER